MSTQRGWLAEKDPEARERMVAITRMITASPALLAREQQVFERYTAALAALLAEETSAGPGDVAPWVAANAMLGIHRALVDHTRRGILAGASRARLVSDLREQAGEALAVLGDGLGDYAVKPR